MRDTESTRRCAGPGSLPVVVAAAATPPTISTAAATATNVNLNDPRTRGRRRGAEWEPAPRRSSRSRTNAAVVAASPFSSWGKAGAAASARTVATSAY
ncbi:MAG TPA: hypothetical protein VE664_02745, partial [Actinomycetes bacterium]|nr:hypothetical protein [Actinomycetes bacterium]